MLERDVPADRADVLLGLLPRLARERLLQRCIPVQLQLGEVLARAGQRVVHAYFPSACCISLQLPGDGGRSLEVGLVGAEGMLGLPLLLGQTTAPLLAQVQGAGPAWRLEATALLAELQCNAELNACLCRYAAVLLQQRALAMACLRFHELGPRLARWLLLGQDRLRQPQLHITQERLAALLGVRRVGVTNAAGALQRQGLIHYHRGQMQVLDRGGLEAAACSCYRRERLAWQLGMGSVRPTRSGPAKAVVG